MRLYMCVCSLPSAHGWASVCDLMAACLRASLSVCLSVCNVYVPYRAKLRHPKAQIVIIIHIVLAAIVPLALHLYVCVRVSTTLCVDVYSDASYLLVCVRNSWIHDIGSPCGCP